jgi:uncharacterized membrane protein
MTTPAWALSLAYWLHMLATVAWIGGLAALSLLVLPAARQALDLGSYAALLARIQRRMDPIGWFSLAILAATGMFQMSASPNYSGFLAIDNRWAAAILIKHILFFGMAGISAYMTWGLLPQLRRQALLQAHSPQSGQASQELARISQRDAWLLRLNLALGVIILGLTAIARAA